MSCVIISFVVLLLGMFSVSCLAETENVANELHRLEQKHNVTIQLPSYLNEEECYDELERIDTFLTSNPLVIRVMIESVSTAVNDAVENEKAEGVEPRKPVTVTKSGTASVEVNARGQLSYSIGVSTILTDLQTFLDTIDLVTL